jgi:hypothetical protein
MNQVTGVVVAPVIDHLPMFSASDSMRHSDGAKSHVQPWQFYGRVR